MKSNKKIAKERIKRLFELSKEALKEGKVNFSKRYITLALKIAQKYKIKITELKKEFCKNCHVYWIPGKTVRVRTQKKDMRITYTCLLCGFVRRFPYVKEKKTLKKKQF